MKHSEEFDREQRRVKGEKRLNWAKVLIRPLTAKTLFKITAWITQVVAVVFKIIDLFKE